VYTTIAVVTTFFTKQIVVRSGASGSGGDREGGSVKGRSVSDGSGNAV